MTEARENPHLGTLSIPCLYKSQKDKAMDQALIRTQVEMPETAEGYDGSGGPAGKPLGNWSVLEVIHWSFTPEIT